MRAISAFASMQKPLHCSLALLTSIALSLNVSAQPSSAVIAGRAVEDLTGNGVTMDDTPIANRILHLFRDNGDGVFSATSDTLIKSETTKRDGAYAFRNLAAGTYFVRQSLPAFWVQTAPKAPEPDNIITLAQCGQAPSEKNDTISTAIATGLSSATPGTYVACGKIGDGGQKALDVDLFRVQVNAGHLLHIDVDAEAFGSTLDPQVRIFDANGHPVACDDEEHGLEAWIAFLDVNNDGVLNNPEGNGLPTALAKEPWALTDNQGNFQIVNLGPGTYPARLVPKAGWTQTTDNPDPIPARSGQNISSLKFGLRSNSN